MAKKDRLDLDEITANLKTKRIGRKVVVYNSTASTNDVAAEYAKNKSSDGLVVFAEQQTRGRGRTGAKWQSGTGDSILCSIVLTRAGVGHELLSLAAAVAVAEAIGKIADNHARIKWPNDIILNGKKVAGILLESKTLNRRISFTLGIGINCHQKKSDFDDEIRKTATSIDIENKTICDRISLAKRLLASIEHWLEIAETDSKKLITRWQRHSLLLNHRVTLIYDGRKFAGNCIGIDPQKGLILQLDTGAVRIFHAAQTTIEK